MTSSLLERLARSSALLAEPSTPREVETLLCIAKNLLVDSKRTEISSESRFRLAYDAAHAYASIALRLHGYRAENRHLVFRSLEQTVGLTPMQCRLFSLCYERRRTAQPEASPEIEEMLLRGLTRAVEDLAERVSSLKSSSVPPHQHP
jgi:hypothetical protein